MKTVRIWSFLVHIFSHLAENRKLRSNLRIQSECGKNADHKNSQYGQFLGSNKSSLESELSLKLSDSVTVFWFFRAFSFWILFKLIIWSKWSLRKWFLSKSTINFDIIPREMKFANLGWFYTSKKSRCNLFDGTEKYI